jgi:hypothetical protein
MIFKREVPFEELDLPGTVYKYRVWTDPKHRTILTQREVFFAAPKSFKDPLDCKNPIRYDLLKEEDIYNKYLLASKEKNPSWSRQQHRKFARDWTKISPLKDKDYIKQAQEESFEDFNSRFGVLSLTANPANCKMWTEYGKDHTGFCVGFNPRVMFKFFGGGGIVNYVDELPIIMPMPIHDFDTQHNLQVFSKLKKWIYEEEYRVHKFSSNPYGENERVIVLPEEAYSEIILGAKIDPEYKIQIIDACMKNLSRVTLKQAHLKKDSLIEINHIE